MIILKGFFVGRKYVKNRSMDFMLDFPFNSCYLLTKKMGKRFLQLNQIKLKWGQDYIRVPVELHVEPDFTAIIKQART